MKLFQNTFVKERSNMAGDTPQKIKFSIKDFFSKCNQIHSFLQIWSHLLKESLMENFIFCVVSKAELQPGPSQTSKNFWLSNNNKRLLAVNYSCKALHLTCL